MIYENVELHNIAELVDVPGRPGLRMQRVPESVRRQLEEPAQDRTTRPAGAEIRFVMKGDHARVMLSSSGDPGTATVFFGPFESRLPIVHIGSDPTPVDVYIPEVAKERFLGLTDGLAAKMYFHPRVCRIVLFHGNIHLHGIEGDVRPPRDDEKPRLTMLSYGTSITHGAAASAFHLSYVGQTAWRLKTDLINLGVGGACRAEAAFGDYIAGRDDWDFATLALSVNMMGAGFTQEIFRERVRYVVGKVAGDNPRKPVFCISIYPHFRDWIPDWPGTPEGVTGDAFRRILEEVVKEIGTPNLHFIPGPEILTDIGGLSADQIHPSDFGMIEMGENLARRMRVVVERL